MGLLLILIANELQTGYGLSNESTPEKIEMDLLKIIPKEYLKDVNHLFVYHGRKICDSRKPKCDICPINHLCEKNI